MSITWWQLKCLCSPLTMCFHAPSLPTTYPLDPLLSNLSQSLRQCLAWTTTRWAPGLKYTIMLRQWWADGWLMCARGLAAPLCGVWLPLSTKSKGVCPSETRMCKFLKDNKSPMSPWQVFRNSRTIFLLLTSAVKNIPLDQLSLKKLFRQFSIPRRHVWDWWYSRENEDHSLLTKSLLTNATAPKDLTMTTNKFRSWTFNQ
jgi:hypothetical protein